MSLKLNWWNVVDELIEIIISTSIYHGFPGLSSISIEVFPPYYSSTFHIKADLQRCEKVDNMSLSQRPWYSSGLLCWPSTLTFDMDTIRNFLRYKFVFRFRLRRFKSSIRTFRYWFQRFRREQEEEEVSTSNNTEFTDEVEIPWNSPISTDQREPSSPHTISASTLRNYAPNDSEDHMINNGYISVAVIATQQLDELMNEDDCVDISVDSSVE